MDRAEAYRHLLTAVSEFVAEMDDPDVCLVCRNEPAPDDQGAPKHAPTCAYATLRKAWSNALMVLTDPKTT